MPSLGDGRGLSRLMLRWPDIRHRLKARYADDANMRALCDAYEDAHEALEKRRCSAAETAAEVSEYTHVIDEMEGEIRLLVAPEQPPGPATAQQNRRRWSPARLVRQLKRLLVWASRSDDR